MNSSRHEFYHLLLLQIEIFIELEACHMQSTAISARGAIRPETTCFFSVRGSVAVVVLVVVVVVV